MALTPEELALEIDAVGFPLGRRGYDMQQVDAFLDGLAADLRAGRDIGPALDAVDLRVRRFLPTYDRGAVDHVLASIRAQAETVVFPGE